MRHSIQWRLQVWHGTILALVLVAFGSLAWREAWLEEVRHVDAELGEAIDQVLHLPDNGRGPGPPPPPPGGPPRGGPPPGRPPGGGVDQIQSEIVRNIWELERTRPASRQNDYYLFLNTDGSLLARSSNAPAGVPLPASARPPGQRRKGMFAMGPGPVAQDARTREAYREVYRVLPLGDTIVAGRSLEGVPARMRGRLAVMGLSALALLGLGLAGGWWITRRALAPIQEISRTAAEIASGDLGRRIDAGSSESELGQMAGVLNDTFDRLQASFDRQARFTSDASHELRTPIAVLISKIQTTLARDRAPGEYQDALRVCLRAAQRMRALTESLLTLSRLDAREEQVGRERVDLAQVAGETLDFLEERAAQQGLTLDRGLEPATASGDAGRFSQVVTNLVMNAIQHTPEGGRVSVRTWVREGLACLEVSDTGKGIPAEDLGRVFDRFYRADKSRTGQAGTGLGLSITRAIVEAHGGRIEMRSVVGEGTTAVVSFPA